MSTQEKILFGTELTAVRNATASVRIKFTALAASKLYLVCGANTGSLYVFNRANYEMLRLVSNADIGDSISLLKFYPFEDDVLAVSTVKNIIYILKLNILDRNNKEKILHKITDHKEAVTCIQWSPEINTQKLFSADSAGLVYLTDLKKTLILNRTNLLFETPEKCTVVQLDCTEKQILISNLKQVYLIDFEKQNLFKVGTKTRNGEYGVCFHPTAGNRILASRPGKNLWEADGDTAKVLSTLKLKDSFNSTNNTTITTRFALPGPKVKLTNVQLGKLERFGNYVISWDSATLILIDPVNQIISEWHIDVNLIQLVVIEEMIYILNSANDVNSIFQLVSFTPVDYAKANIQRASSEKNPQEVWIFCATLAVSTKLSDYTLLQTISDNLSNFNYETSNLAEFPALLKSSKAEHDRIIEEKRMAKEREENEKRRIAEEIRRKEEEEANRLKEEIERQRLEREKQQLRYLDEKRKQEAEEALFKKQKAEEEQRRREERIKKQLEKEKEMKIKEQKDLERIEKEQAARRSVLFANDPLSPQKPAPAPSKTAATPNKLSTPSTPQLTVQSPQVDSGIIQDQPAVLNLLYTEASESAEASSSTTKRRKRKIKKPKVKQPRIVEIAPPKLKATEPKAIVVDLTNSPPIESPVNILGQSPPVSIPQQIPEPIPASQQPQNRGPATKFFPFSINIPGVSSVSVPNILNPSPVSLAPISEPMQQPKATPSNPPLSSTPPNTATQPNTTHRDLKSASVMGLPKTVESPNRADAYDYVEQTHEPSKNLYETLPQSKIFKQFILLQHQNQPVIVFTPEQRLDLHEWIMTFDTDHPFNVPHDYLQTLITFCFEQEIDGIHDDQIRISDWQPIWTEDIRVQFVKKYYIYLHLQRVFYICNQLQYKETLEYLLDRQTRVPDHLAPEPLKILNARKNTINLLNQWIANSSYNEATSCLLTRNDTGLCLAYLHTLLCCPDIDEVISFLKRIYPVVLPRNVYKFLTSSDFMSKSKLEMYRARKVFIISLTDLVNREPLLRQDSELIYNWMAQCMKHDAPEVNWLYTKVDGELVPKERTHLLDWGHADIIMSLIQQPHIYAYDRSRILRLCKEHGFFRGLIYLYTYVQDYTPAIDIVLYTDDAQSFERMCHAFNTQNWAHILAKWPKVVLKSPRRSITTEIIVSTLLQSLGSIETINLLTRAREFSNNIPLHVYKDLLNVSKLSIQQDNLLPKLLEGINTHLWSQRSKEMAPQSQYSIEYELRQGNLPYGEFDNTEELPWFFEEYQNNWGVPTKIVSGYCPSCTLPIKETKSSVVVFRCGHAYHQSCSPESGCRQCFSMDSLLNW